MNTDDTRDRLIALEVEVRNLTKLVENMSVTLEKVDGVLQQATGAKWLVIVLAGVMGFFTSKATTLIGWK
mgnify:CR=1 FL=1